MEQKVEEIKQSNNYQLQTIIDIHDDSVMNIIILKDLRFASSSCDKTIKIFNKDTYKIEINILEHKDYVAYIYQLKNEKLISSSSDNTIKIFKLFKNSYNIEQILTGHSKPVKKTIELINGDLVSCSWDKTIKIWNKNNNNLYTISFQFYEEREIHSVYEINDKEFFSISCNNDFEEEDDRAITFYKINNKEYDIVNIIENITISGFQSNAIKLNEKYFLISGKSKIYYIDIITHNINKIYELKKDSWISSLKLLNNGNLITGDTIGLMIFKIIDNNLELIFDINNTDDNIDTENYHVISSIQEDSNKNIIISSYAGKIKIFSKTK